MVVDLKPYAAKVTCEDQTVTVTVQTREQMNVVIVGHVDHGKSSIVGRLMADTGSLSDGKLEQVKLNCEKNSKPFEYAFLLDALKDEQAQGITIDTARAFLKTKKRDYILIDTPGHIEFLKNMFTGASRAEAALLVIDASEGVQENTRRHGYLLQMLGIKQLVVLVNKMDLAGYSQKAFDHIVSEYGQFLDQIDGPSRKFIPVCGISGDNIAVLSKRMPWYRGDTVLDVLDFFQKEDPLFDKPFRMPVQGVYKFTRFGDNRRIVVGMPESGRLQVGDEVVFYPSGKKSSVRSVESFPPSDQKIISAGDVAGFTLAEQIYVSRGELATRFSEPKPEVSTRFQARLFWMGKEPLRIDKTYWLKIGTAKTSIVIEKILRVINASSLNMNTEKQIVDRHEAAEVVIRTKKPVAFDLCENSSSAGRFVLVDGYEIAGGGTIQKNLDEHQHRLHEQVRLRELKWIPSGIPTEERASRFRQSPYLILITGEINVPRKELARALEIELYKKNFEVYYLGFGSVRYGVDADLKNDELLGQSNNLELQEPFSQFELTEVHQEHIRRFGEIANILLDAGLIMIATAISLTEDDLSIIQASVPSSKIFTIWLGETVTTDLDCDVVLNHPLKLEDNIGKIIEELYRRKIFMGSNFPGQQ